MGAFATKRENVPEAAAFRKCGLVFLEVSDRTSDFITGAAVRCRYRTHRRGQKASGAAHHGLRSWSFEDKRDPKRELGIEGNKKRSGSPFWARGAIQPPSIHGCYFWANSTLEAALS